MGPLCGMEAMEEQEGDVAGVLSPSQLGAVKTLVRMCGSAKKDALEPLRKLVSITDRRMGDITLLEQLRNEYNVSLLNPYLKNGPKKGRKPIALGGKPNQPGHRAGPKRKRDVDEASSSQLTFAEAPSPPADEDFEAADGGFMSDVSISSVGMMIARSTMTRKTERNSYASGWKSTWPTS